MMLRQVKHKLSGERGQSALELALILPILLMLVVGIAEFGRAWMTVNVLTGAVREGARLAAVTPDLGANRDQVQGAVTELLNTANLQPAFVRVSVEPAMPNTVRVEAAVEFSFVQAPFFQILFGEGYTFYRSASCYYEGQI